MKQKLLFEFKEEGETTYTKNINSPIYEPKNKKPHILELYDNSKAKRLIRNIKNSNISEEEKFFLTICAYRHTVFNYELIADYYANSKNQTQLLMEDSALVIIDFEKAIELGYVNLSKSIKKQYLEDYGE